MKIVITLTISTLLLANIVIRIECLNPLDVLKTCLTDSQCKEHEEFCDHTGINPIGSCRVGYELGAKCHFDRHCKTKHCHLTRCVSRKPVKDGLCSKNQHDDCIESQFCAKSGSVFKCKDRMCSGWCCRHSQCLSNKCSWLFRCTQPENGCDAIANNN